jgi:hypothetical protein
MQQCVRLEDWFFIKPKGATSASGYLRGSVFGHPHIADGSTIQTTLIMSMDNCSAQTTNTIYMLGQAQAQAALKKETPRRTFSVGLGTGVNVLVVAIKRGCQLANGERFGLPKLLTQFKAQ